MKIEWTLQGAGQRPAALTLQARNGAAGKIQPVLSAQDVCRTLKKSRRQVYRYIRSGKLEPCARILGQWLFAPAALERFRERRVPGFLRRYFWDVHLSELSPSRHREFVLERLLEFGDQKAARWAWKIYGRKALRAFLQGRGREVLSRRAWNFWTQVIGGAAFSGHRAGWRRAGRRWGGVE